MSKVSPHTVVKHQEWRVDDGIRANTIEVSGRS